MSQIENPMVLPNGYGIRDPQEQDVLYGIDALGNEVHYGDEIIVFDDEFVLVEVLNSEAIEFLTEVLGAEKKIAEK